MKYVLTFSHTPSRPQVRKKIPKNRFSVKERPFSAELKRIVEEYPFTTALTEL